MKKINETRKCVMCKTTQSIFNYGITYAPRTTHDKGWLNKQCKRCYENGGISMEEVFIRQELEKKMTEFNELKEYIKDIRTLIRHIEKKTIMKDEGDVIEHEDVLTDLFSA